jgi:hypothetical protein
MLLGGAGMGAAMAPATAAGLSGIPVGKAGVGSAVLNTSRQLGGSIGIAVLGAVMAHEVGGRASPEAFVHGLSVALDVSGAIALAGALVALALVRPPVALPRTREARIGAREGDASWTTPDVSELPGSAARRRAKCRSGADGERGSPGSSRLCSSRVPVRP